MQETPADGGAPFKPAPSFPLPSRSLLCVEHPAHVRDVQRAITTLGGLPALTKAFEEAAKLLELRFRPEDPYAHPLFGDYTLGSSLLLKVTRRRKKAAPATPATSSTSSSSTPSSVPQPQQDKPSDFKAEVVAMIPAVYQFKGMADFQYVPPSEVVVKEQRGAFQLVSQDWGEKDEPMHLPPPIFSKVDMPQNYRFLPNLLFRVVEEQGPDGEVTKKFERALRRQPATSFRLPAVAFDEEVVPQGAPPDDQRKSKDLKRLEGLLRTLFEQRPVWSTVALRANVPSELASKVKRALSAVAYHFKSGPWRKMWVRYGYDPRQHTDARVYQVIDFRVPPGHTRQRHLGYTQHAPRRRKLNMQMDVSTMLEPASAPSQVERKELQLEHRFAILPSRQQTLYQLCDIDDTRIQKLVQAPDAFTTTCNRANGFYTQRTLDAIRKLMTERLTMLVNEANTKSKRGRLEEGEGEAEEEELPSPAGTPMQLPGAGAAQEAAPPAPLAVHAEKIGASMSMLERMLRAGVGGAAAREGAKGGDDDDEDEEVEPFEILDGAAAGEARPGFYSRLLMQDEEPNEYPDDEESEDEEESEEDEDPWA